MTCPDLGEIELCIKKDVAEATAEAEDAAVARYAGHLVGRRVRFSYHDGVARQAEGIVTFVSINPEIETLTLSVEHRSRNSGHMVTRDMSRYAILGWLDEVKS